MKIETKYHGTVEYEEKDIIAFKKGLPGFEEFHKFIVFPLEDNPYFKILQSVKSPEIGLVAANPFDFIEDYEVSLSNDLQKDLEVEKPEDVLILNTVTLNSEVSKITTNLKAPIVININKKLGEQIILDNEKYSIKHPLVRE
ncbi:flagellar assembly protein FliW [Clostridium tunisiense]|uniref:flagellar assembly protein FliW n=1 Tax=Clostridium tunisiense TaxID=219748 RepID=UPI0002D8F941|nr:flagellar assembly protein FliW [Clostridium tunisiense]